MQTHALSIMIFHNQDVTNNVLTIYLSTIKFHLKQYQSHHRHCHKFSYDDFVPQHILQPIMLLYLCYPSIIVLTKLQQSWWLEFWGYEYGQLYSKPCKLLQVSSYACT